MKNLKNLRVILISTVLMLNSTLFAQTVDETESEFAQKVSMTLLKTLGKNLKMHMKKEGPVGAAKFCSLEALNITQEVSEKYGKKVDVKRISLKYRNPVNAPTQEQIVVLKKLEALNAEQKLPKLYKQENNDSTTYYKPLVIKKKVCLKCHGNITTSALKNYIEKTYPEDEARGYKMGDLRGAVLVKIEK